MATQVELKDGTRIELKGDNLTPEQVAAGVRKFRESQPQGQMRLAAPESSTDGFAQRLAGEGKPREGVSPALFTKPQPASALPFRRDEADPETFLARRGEELEQLRQEGGEVLAGPVSRDVELARAAEGALGPRLGPLVRKATSLGLSIPLSGAASAITGGGFAEGERAERERIAGAELATSPGGQAAIEAAGAVGLGGPSKALLTRVPGLLGSAGLAAKSGAIFGGVSEGATTEGGIVKRGQAALSGAVTGAGIGVGVGLGAPLLFNAASKAFTAVGNRVAANLDKLNGRERRALKAVMRAFEEDGIPPEEARRRLAQWTDQGGEPAALFDIGGPSVERLARSLGGKISRTASRLQSEVETRLSAQADEIADSLARTVSRETNYAQAVDSLHAFRQAQAAPLYEEAYKFDVTITPELRRILSRPAVKRAIPRAERIAGNEDIKLEDLGLIRRADGTVSFDLGDKVNVRLIDYLKRGIDEDLNTRFRDKTTLRLNLTDESRGIESTRRALLQQADRQAPAFKEARAAWSGTTETLNAMALGKDIFSPRLTADDLAKRVAGMAEGDKEYLRAGVVRAIIGKVENTPDGANAVRKFFAREAFRKKLRMIFDDRVQMENFEALMRRQLDKVSRTQRVAPSFGSQTQLRGADVEARERFAEDIFSGRPVRAAMGAAARGAVRSLRDKRALAQQDLENEAVFETLFGKDNPLRLIEQGQAFRPGFAVQRGAAAVARPGTVALHKAVDELLTPNQPQSR